MISRAMVEARLEQLRVELAEKLSDVQALHGAIQDCEFWLGVVVKDSESAEFMEEKAPPDASKPVSD